jgi:hypothetical protein
MKCQIFMSKKAKLIFSACLLAVNFSQAAFAQTATGAGAITTISTGWGGDFFGIKTTAPVVNPAGCSATDLYDLASTDPAYKTHYAAALTAYTTGSQVYVIVSNTTCAQSRPTIIGLTVVHP